MSSYSAPVKILIINSDISYLEFLKNVLKSTFTVYYADSGVKGIEIIKNENISAVLFGLDLVNENGENILINIHNQIAPHLPIIVTSNRNNPGTVIKSIKSGAVDFILQNYVSDGLINKISDCIENKESEISSCDSKSIPFICKSESMCQINYMINRLANFDVDVLIEGESGTGKDIVANEIYKRSKRKNNPFIPLPIVSLSENIIESELFGHEKGSFSGAERMKYGKLELADGGFLYLPEISRINENIQLKLLQFMQYKTISRVGMDSRCKDIAIDVRILMATNDNLTELAQMGSLRWDFYYRINAVSIKIPPLRERKEGIMPLAEVFLKNYSLQLYKNKQYYFSPEVIKGLSEYSWPGNVRELSNAVKNALVYTEDNLLTIEHFPFLRLNTPNCSTHSANYKQAEQFFKKEYFSKLLLKTNGNKTRAAQIAGISRQGLFNILKETGLS